MFSVERFPAEFPAMKRSGALGWSVGVILIVVIAAFLHFCKWVDIDRSAGYSEPLSKPYLAAAMFLSRLGIKTDVTDGLSLLDALPPTDATLLIAGSRRALSERRLDGLVEWLRRGGHLIVVASAYWDDETESSTDELLDRYDIRLRRTEAAESGPSGASGLARVVVDLAQIGDATPCDAGVRSRRCRSATRSRLMHHSRAMTISNIRVMTKPVLPPTTLDRNWCRSASAMGD